MVKWNPCVITLITISLSYMTRSNPSNKFQDEPRRSLRYYNRSSRSLLRRKISDSNSHPKVLSDIHDLAGCPGEICGTLAGDAVQPLLAGAPECAQQDMADKMIDIAKTKLQDEKVKNKLIELAKTYRQAERNTFPDYSSPGTPDTNSLFCQKAPKNAELSGLVQAQSKTADANLFFDPKVSGKSIQKGSDPRTQPFGKSQEQPTSPSPTVKDPVEDPGSDEVNQTSNTNPDTGDLEGSAATKSLNSNSIQDVQDTTTNNENRLDEPTSNPPLQKSKHGKIGACRPKKRT